MSNPLVTVVCLCHNHERFVREALNSVAAQTYRNVQLIVVDDASTDDSREKIAQFAETRPDTQIILNSANVGVCRAFNSAFAHARGEFIIDFAADDVLLPERIEAGVKLFSARDDSFGVQFGDAYNIDEGGKTIDMHSDRFPHDSIPQGDIYESLIKRFFICGTSMMMRKKVLDTLGGYDESLSYEDFDLWIRSSRAFKYFYTPTALVKRRIVRGGLHEKQFVSGSPHAWSTLAVCEKILLLNQTKKEQSALGSRLRYEIRQSVMRGDFKLALRYLSLWKRNRS